MIKNNKLKNTSLITGALSLIIATTTPSSAANNNEQCAGVARAGLNDCASVEHICAGMNADDGNDTDWLWVPKGTCNKITGAHIIVTKDPTNNM